MGAVVSAGGSRVARVGELTDLAYRARDSRIIGSTLWEAGYSAGSDAPGGHIATSWRTFAPANIHSLRNMSSSTSRCLRGRRRIRIRAPSDPGRLD